ncbi:hypothetical protein [Citrobacter meridianamericanus]|uniref:Lipoprotein n=1 Tax=Citrobacter meridianamericanus TaxID=2894201 RepID=A0ABT1B702_9ENTR|nr:hypothetical protein [Citrobacter meridianamericanus]MCO5781370.1 hypothetical protein [Citrobacter meridianamericanus]
MRTLKFVTLVCLIMISGCISVDHRVWTEDVDPKFSHDFSGVYYAHPSYASTESDLKHGYLRDHLGFGWDSSDKSAIDFVRLQNETNGDLTFIWLNGLQQEVRRDILTTQKGWKHLENGSFILDPDGGLLSNGIGDPATFGYNKHTIRFFRNTDGNLVVQRSDNAGGAFLVVPVFIVSKHLSIYSRKLK